jgi:transposase-like protein
MKTSRYTEAQIIAILRQAEGGVTVAELCREHGMSNASFYKMAGEVWRDGCVLDQPDEGHGR